jgi:hypothetical protein
MECPRCRGFVLREPSRLVCVCCGREGRILDATDEQRRRQGQLDHERAPQSVECRPPYNSAEYLAPHHVQHRLQAFGPRLPGAMR